MLAPQGKAEKILKRGPLEKMHKTKHQMFAVSIGHAIEREIEIGNRTFGLITYNQKDSACKTSALTVTEKEVSTKQLQKCH